MVESYAECRLMVDEGVLAQHMQEEPVKMETVLHHRMKLEKDMASMSNKLWSGADTLPEVLFFHTSNISVIEEMARSR